MTELLTSTQMRALEDRAMASGRVTGLALMERAGQGVVDAIFAAWPQFQTSGGQAVVLCGPGNNGGDGFVVARLLAGWGWEVTVCATGPSVTRDAQTMRGAWKGAVIGTADLDWPQMQVASLVIDAMFGIGLSRDIAPGIWGLLEMAQAVDCKLVAVDILSGICSDSGRVRSVGGYVDRSADLTVTFERPKLGHHLGAGAELSGHLYVVPLGLEREISALLRESGESVVDLTSVSPLDLSKSEGHKFDYGHALIVSGGHGQAGAARLSARAALRVGAGLVTLASPLTAMVENAARLDAIMLKPVADAEALRALLMDTRINALCIGPGFGLDTKAADLLGVALSTKRTIRSSGASQPLSLVLDADALTMISRDEGLFALLHSRCVVTPHAGEFARLFPDIANKLTDCGANSPAYSKVEATRAAAHRAGCTVLFKGADTVISAPDGRCVINSAAYDRAAPWLATAGSGDVLAGLITGLMARGFAPFDAAGTAAWLHVECARSFGPGLIAEDLPEELPKVFRNLGVK